jgi:flavin reductase (DIM6/NTAB) family NADH-FMN oxidoreductase RutF
VSSFSSLSLDPPLVLLSIDKRSNCHDVIMDSGAFVVNILAEDGEWLSRLFASRDADKFSKVRYRIGRAGAPMLDEALAVIECRLHNQVPGGDHVIFIGEVIATEVRRKAKPLLYFRSGYGQLA